MAAKQVTVAVLLGRDQNGQYPTGCMLAYPTVPLTDNSVNRIYGQQIQVKALDAGGGAAMSLVCTDDPAISPPGQGWFIFYVADKIRSTPMPYAISVANAGQTVDLNDLVPMIGGPSNPYFTNAIINGFDLTPAAPAAANRALAVDVHQPVDATAANRTWTLPAGQPVANLISVEKYDNSTHTVTITGNIRGVPSSSITLSLFHETVVFVADNTGSWWPFAGHKTLASLDARYIPVTAEGAAGGVATLDGTGNVPVSELGNVPPTSGAGIFTRAITT